MGGTMGQIIDINFDWQYKINFEDEDLDVLNGEVQNVDLPYLPKKILNKNNVAPIEDEMLSSYYEKRIEIMKEEEEENVFLCFEGIRGKVQLYINGILAKERYSDYGYLEANITKFIKYNAFNKISVVVKGETGGHIYAPVYIERKATAYIESVAITTKNVLELEKEVDVDIEIVGLVEGMNVQVAIMDNKGNVIANAVSTPLRSLEIKLSMQTMKAKVWDIDNPVLYNLHVFLQHDAHIVDERIIPFGFREVQFQTDGFYLNGNKLKLCGISKGEGLELANYTPIPAMEISDACIIKNELHMNIVKITKEAITPSFLKKCDELGLLICIDVPKWTKQEGLLDEESVHKREFTKFVQAYRNYTSLILWSVGKIEKADEYEKQIHQILKQVDPIRAIGGGTQDESLIDVYMYADHTYIDGGNGLENPDKVAPNSEIPYLVIDHTGPVFRTKSFDTEERLTEYALRHMRILDEARESERICGVIASSFVDMAIPTYLEARRKTCYTGILDCDRQFKLPAYAYASQQDERLVMHVSSNMQGEEGSVAGGIYVFTNCDKVKFYKDEICIGEFYPDKEEFPNLVHPPIYINDYIGESLVTEEGYSPKDAAFMKTVLMAMATQDGELPLDIKGKLLLARFKSHMDKENINRLYEKYILAHENPKTRYVFEGYKGEEKVGTIIKGGYTPARIIAEAERHDLNLGKTYDTTRISIKVVDEYGNLLPYVNDVIRIETTGAVEIIGHTYQSLVGGTLAVYVKTKGEVGTGIVSIKSNELGEGQLIFQVTRK